MDNEFVERQALENSDKNTNKYIMLSFLADTAGLSGAEVNKLSDYARDLPNDITLPEFLTHLRTLEVEADLLEKLKVIGR